MSKSHPSLFTGLRPDFCELVVRMFSILTNPVILTREGRGANGPTDTLEGGINDFFALHSCTRFCDKSWRKPPGTGSRVGRDIRAQRGTVCLIQQRSLSLIAEKEMVVALR